MKRDILIIAAAFMIFFACKKIFKGVKGTGPVTTETRAVTGFKGVDLGVSGDVYMTQGSDFKVVVETQANVAELLETYVDDGVLKIYFKKNTGNVNYDKLIVRIQAPVFESIGLYGSGNMVAENAFKGQNLAIILAGSGEVNIKDATYNSLKADITGSGNLAISGTAESSDLQVSGSGDIEAAGLKSKQTKADVVGSGNIDCQAETNLDANIVGSGDIHYSGNPSVKSRVTGSGDIVKK